MIDQIFIPAMLLAIWFFLFYLSGGSLLVLSLGIVSVLIPVFVYVFTSCQSDFGGFSCYVVEPAPTWHGVLFSCTASAVVLSLLYVGWLGFWKGGGSK